MEELSAIPVWLCIPFAGLLLSIAVMPLFKPDWWEKHQPLAVAFWSVLFIVPFAAKYGMFTMGETVLECVVNDYLTFIVLLFGLFCVAGNITIDGVDTKDMTRENVHRKFGMVLQDTWLFEGSVRENLLYNNENVSEETMINACKACGIHSFIKALPQGYDTVLTGDGANLSQGQRQLLAIARAAIADPPALILDEATSSIDTRTERLVQDGMDKLMHGRTTFVIAHRLSTIQNSDCIMVLEQGRIIERGTHEELLEKKGRYYQLYTGNAVLA